MHTEGDDVETTAFAEGPPRDSIEAARAASAVERALFGAAAATTIGRFVVLERLGQGGMGVVYAAWDPQLQRRIAVKVVDPRASGEHGSARLVAEARAAARLSHPNVVAVHDVGEAAARVFIAMEYVEGQTLAAFDAQSHGVATCLDLYLQAARGLAAAHAVGLVHRDFKPANVLVSREADGRRRARVADFGLASRSAAPPPTDAGDDDDDEDLRLTKTGALLGTPAYMAPEQFAGAQVDARADQFGFCVALYEALHGRNPFEGDSVVERRAAVLAGRVSPSSRGRVDARIDAVLRRGLKVDPDERFADLGALIGALESARHRRRGWVLAGMAAAVASIAVVVALRTPSAVAPCEGLGEPWYRDVDPLAAEVEQAVADSGVPSADRLAASARRTLDDYGADWIAQRQAVCTATRIQRTQSEATMEVRMACLDRTRLQAETILRRLGSDPAALPRVLDVIASLDPPRRCATAGEEEGRPPRDPARRETYDAILAELAEVRADFALSAWKQGHARAKDVVGRIEAAELRPVLATAKSLLAAFEARVGDPKAARALATEALGVAIDLGQPRTAGEIANSLIWIDGYLLGHHEVAERDGQLALAWQSAGRAAPSDRVGTLDNLGINAYAMNDYDLAAARHREALAGATDEATKIRIAINLAAALQATGGAEGIAEGRAQLEDALVRAEALYGPDNPMVAAILHNLAGLGPRYVPCSEARPRLERALRIKIDNYGETAIPLASTLGALAECDLVEGRPDGALARRRQAVAILEAKVGPDNPKLLPTLQGLASALVATGALDEAERTIDRVAAIQAAHYPADDPYRYGVVAARAELVGARGDRDAQRAMLREAIELATVADPQSLEVQGLQLRLARAHAAAGDAAGARAVAQQVVAALAGDPEHGASVRADARELLASLPGDGGG